MIQVHCFESAEEIAARLAARLEAALFGPASADIAVMLAGGRTPLAAYGALAARGARPSGARVFLSDERMAPADAEENNGRHIAPSLQQAGLAGERFLRVDTTLPLEEAAAAYHAALAALVSRGVRMEFGLLGLGPDGHTASLFTAADVEAARRSGQMAVAVRRAQPPDRVSVTPGLLAMVAQLVFVVTGAGKAAVVRQLLDHPLTIAAGLATDGHPNVHLWADRAALPASE